MWTPTSPVTGAVVPGFTSPTFTLTLDRAPDGKGIQHAVTALGGTQVGVVPTSASIPFLHKYVKPEKLKYLGAVNPVTGLLRSVPRNNHSLLTIKGVIPLAGQPSVNMFIRTIIEIPAGSEIADVANVKAAISAHVGLLSQQATGLCDTIVSNVQ